MLSLCSLHFVGARVLELAAEANNNMEIGHRASFTYHIGPYSNTMAACKFINSLVQGFTCFPAAFVRTR